MRSPISFPLLAIAVAAALSSLPVSSVATAVLSQTTCHASKEAGILAVTKDLKVGDAFTEQQIGALKRTCPDVAFTSLGHQSYIPLESANPQLLQLWKVDGKQQRPYTDDGRANTVQHVFLAWERIDDGRPDDGSRTWASRIERMLASGPAGSNGRAPFVIQAADASMALQRKEALQDRGPLLSDTDALEPAKLLDLHATYAIVRTASLGALHHLSERLPRDTRMSRLLPVATDALAQHDKVKLPVPRYIPPLHALLFSETLSVEALRKDARTLTGEDTKGQQRKSVGEKDTVYWHSRHSATYGARAAAAWIRERMQHDLSSIGGTCVEWEYDPEFAPNVVCTIPADEEKRDARMAAKSHDATDATANGSLLFTSHLDSRGSFGSTLAPGGNDDGSGTTMLLALARHLGQHQVTFAREVRLIAFSGEEQGLVGSQHYARHLNATQQPVYFQLQTDMIGYRKPGEPLQAAFPDKLATAAATDYVMAIARIYVPELQLGYTPACCSDHQSFWEVGVTSTWLFERRGPIADDRYHDSGDITNRTGYDFDQIRANTRLVLATLLDVGKAVEWPYAAAQSGARA